MTKTEILLEKVCVKKKGGCNMCAWCFQLLLHSEKEKLESVFLVACSWLQTPTPVLPMIRKSAMWNLPNPMVSTASSTVNVFCPVTPTGKKETKQNRISRQVVPPQVFMKYERLMWTVPVERLETPNLPWHGCCEPRLGTVLPPQPYNSHSCCNRHSWGSGLDIVS